MNVKKVEVLGVQPLSPEEATIFLQLAQRRFCTRLATTGDEFNPED